jgi:hypothetical protein
VRQFCVQYLSKRPFNKFFNVFGPALTRYAGIASSLPCHRFFCEFIIKEWALKAIVQCVVLLVLYQGVSTRGWHCIYFLINFVVWVFFDKEFKRSDIFTIVLWCVILPFFNLNVCGFSRLDTPLHEFTVEVISGGAFHCCIVCASFFVR